MQPHTLGGVASSFAAYLACLQTLAVFVVYTSSLIADLDDCL